MSLKEVFVIKGNVTDNAKTIRNDAEFIGITEMSINVHLLYCLVRGSMCGHGTIGYFVRIIGIIKVMGFLEGFQLFDNAVCVFRIIFCNPCFNTGGIKDGHGSKCGIQFLADRFGQINEMIKHRL